MSDDATEWDEVAAAALHKRNSYCPADGCSHMFQARDGSIPVHFAKLTDKTPCFGSWKSICQSCGGLVHDGKHVSTGVKECGAAPAKQTAGR